MKVYKQIMDFIAGVEKIVMSVLLVFVTVITFANVVVRKLSDSQFAWTEELVINLFVLLIMLGCGLCAREGQYIRSCVVASTFRSIRYNSSRAAAAVRPAAPRRRAKIQRVRPRRNEESS